MKYIVYYADKNNLSVQLDKVFIDKPEDAYNYMIDQIDIHRKYDEDFNEDYLRINESEAYYRNPKNKDVFYYMISATNCELYNG